MLDVLGVVCRMCLVCLAVLRVMAVLCFLGLHDALGVLCDLWVCLCAGCASLKVARKCCFEQDDTIFSIIIIIIITNHDSRHAQAGDWECLPDQ